MDRKTNIRDMDAPGVASGKVAGDSVLAHTAEYPLPAEKDGNTLEQYKTEAQPKSDLGGKNKMK